MNASKDNFFSKLGNRKQRGTPNHAALTPADWLMKAREKRVSFKAPAPVNDVAFDRLCANLKTQSANIIGPVGEGDLIKAITSIAADQSDKSEDSGKNLEIICGADLIIETLRKSAGASASQLTFTAWQGKDSSTDSHMISLTRATAAASETGTLFFTSGNENPTPLNFLASCHIALLNRNDITETYEQAFDKCLSTSSGSANQIPRTINMISGPSRTADIEQSLTLGAHGPIELHVLIWQ